MRFGSVFALFALGLSSCAGASPGGEPAKDPLSQATVSAVDLPPDRVAFEIHQLLLEPRLSEERLNRLASVTRAQMKRAGARFDRGQEVEGMNSTMGAILMIRSPEYRPELFTGSTHALLKAAAHVSRLGDEGRALAFYRLADEQLEPSPAKQEVEQHLSALRSWQASATEVGSMQAAGAQQRAVLNEALVVCTRENRIAATESSLHWLNRAIVEGRRDAPPSTFFEHDERMEARRAVLTAALSLSALFVRDGDVYGALEALQREPIASAASEKLIARLESAGDGNPEAWADLFGLFESAGDPENGALSSELSRGGAFGAAVGLYQLEPTELRAAIPLSTLMVEHGMADVAPLILGDVIDGGSKAQEMDWALRLVFGALNRAENTGEIDMARRVFDNAAPLIDLAGKRKTSTNSAPSAADFHYVMGAMEVRAGDLEQARPRLAHAIADQPSRDALRLLAAIDRQRGDLSAALESIDAIRALTAAEGDPLGEGRALLFAFEIQRDMKQESEAAASLALALTKAQLSRSRARTGSEVGLSELLFSDVLERYGQLDAANRASERAFDASQHDLGRLTAAILDASRRALTFGDVATSRKTLRRALDEHLESDALVYVALWTLLTQKQQGVHTDGSVEEALDLIDSGNRWTQALRDWGKGGASGTNLMALANGPAQQAEAEFYLALGPATAESKEASLAKLRNVANSTAIELIEVRIARDLIAQAEGHRPPALPSGIDLP